MGHALLGRERRFGEGHAQLGRQEQRIIAEPAVAARRREDPALARRLHELRLGSRRLDVRYDAAMAGGGGDVVHGGEALERERVVRRIYSTVAPASFATMQQRPR